MTCPVDQHACRTVRFAPENAAILHRHAVETDAAGVATHGAGKVDVQDLALTHKLDKASVNLMQHCAKGTQFETATLVCRKASGDGGQLEYYTMVMKHVIITSVQGGGSEGDDDLFESFTLNFGEYTSTYVPQDNDGSALPEVGPLGWNMQTNEPV